MRTPWGHVVELNLAFLQTIIAEYCHLNIFEFFRHWEVDLNFIVILTYQMLRYNRFTAYWAIYLHTVFLLLNVYVLQETLVMHGVTTVKHRNLLFGVLHQLIIQADSTLLFELLGYTFMSVFFKDAYAAFTSWTVVSSLLAAHYTKATLVAMIQLPAFVIVIYVTNRAVILAKFNFAYDAAFAGFLNILTF